MLLFISLFFKEGIINKLIEMNSLIKICPYCKKHMKYALDKQFIKMNCKCNTSTIPISVYYSLFNNNLCKCSQHNNKQYNHFCRY